MESRELCDKTTRELGWAEREVPFFQPGVWGFV